MKCLQIIYEAMLRYLAKCLCWNEVAINPIIIAPGCALLSEQGFLGSGIFTSSIMAPMLVLLNSYLGYNSIWVSTMVSTGPEMFM